MRARLALLAAAAVLLLAAGRYADAPWATPRYAMACEGAARGCVLEAPCASPAPSGYTRSLAASRALLAAGRWATRPPSAAPYQAHALENAGLPLSPKEGCASRPERPMPALLLPERGEVAPALRTPAELVAQLGGIRRLVLVGDSTLRYAFSALAHTYCLGHADCVVDGRWLRPKRSRAKVGKVMRLAVGERLEVFLCFEPFFASPTADADTEGRWQLTGAAPDAATAATAAPLRLVLEADPATTAVVVRASHYYTPHMLAGCATAACSGEYQRSLRALLEPVQAHGARLVLLSPTLTASRAGPYQPRADRNLGPQRLFETHRVACALGVDVLDLWALEAPCLESQKETVTDAHYCLPGVPDIEVQLVLDYLADGGGLPSGSNGGGGAPHECECPATDVGLCAGPERV